VVHFGFWTELLDKWAAESHLTPKEAKAWGDGNATDAALSARLGFDFNWSTALTGIEATSTIRLTALHRERC
jgi:hypothetical protein